MEELVINNYWEIIKINSNGVRQWDGQSRTEGIAGFEHIFKEDIDGDGEQGIKVGDLKPVTTDTTGDLLKTSNGMYFIYDDSAPDTRIDIRDESGGIPTVGVTEEWEGGSYTQLPIAVERIDGGASGDDADDHYRLVSKDRPPTPTKTRTKMSNNDKARKARVFTIFTILASMV